LVIVFVVILLLLAVEGAILLALGLRVRRRGETPHCRRCDYALTGLASPERCPEMFSLL